VGRPLVFRVVVRGLARGVPISLGLCTTASIFCLRGAPKRSLRVAAEAGSTSALLHGKNGQDGTVRGRLVAKLSTLYSHLSIQMA